MRTDGAVSPENRIGASPLRREDARFISGRGRYVSDMNVPGQLHCAFVRSPHAHAHVLAIDAQAARAMPGVAAILDGAAMAAEGVGPMRALWPVRGADGPAIEPPRYGLARGMVHHIGEAVAVVLAATPAEAEDAALAVQVQYQPLPVVVSAQAALRAGAPCLHPQAPGNLCYRYERGNRAATEAAFARAPHVVRVSLVNQRLAGCALEPRALLAQPVADGVTLYAATQVPHHIRTLLCEQLALPAAAVRVVAPDVGGGFGYKGKHYPEETVLAWAARRLQRPLKWVASRSESFLSDLQGRDHVTEAQLALDDDGVFLALRADTLVNLGAYVSSMGSAISSAVYTSLLSGMYRTPALFAEVRGVFTNTLPTDAYRGAGRPEACYVVEQLTDAAAHLLKLDRAELRRRNLIPASAMPYATSAGPVYDSGDFARVLERALVLSDYAGFAARCAAAPAHTSAVTLPPPAAPRASQPPQRAGAVTRSLRGIGIACYVESSGVGPSKFARAGGARVDLAEYASIEVASDGRITATLGTQNHGQGHETVFAQILAQQLGVAPALIDIVEGDTARIARGTGTFGSRSIAVGGSALVLAARDLIAQGWQPQGASQAPAQHHTLGQSHGVEPKSWHASAGFDPAAFAFSNGVHVCEVEIDQDTGAVRVLRYTAVDDAGTIMHPVIVEGQLHGGVAQGLGQALLEACVYDPESGQLLSGSFLDYGLPRAHTMPQQFDVENDESQPFSLNPLGAKGAGEAGTIAAPAALMLAVQHALRPLGVSAPDMPLTPARLWAALQTAAMGRASG